MCCHFWRSWSAKVSCVSLTDTVNKLRARSWREIGMAVEALLLLGVFRAAILLLPFRKITALMGLEQNSRDCLQASRSTNYPADTGWAIQAASARTPWASTCLVQALAGLVMLSRRGIDATICLGVAKAEDGQAAMDAHAWLRCGDSIVTGAGGVERFAAISSFSRPAPHKTDTRKAVQ